MVRVADFLNSVANDLFEAQQEVVYDAYLDSSSIISGFFNKILIGHTGSWNYHTLNILVSQRDRLTASFTFLSAQMSNYF